VLAQGKARLGWRSITLAAVTLAALKLAWRKIFALLAAGRGAEDMATTFQAATLIDHYCAKLHVGGPISQPQAAELRALVYRSVSRTSEDQTGGAFREGARFWGRSLAEAPRCGIAQSLPPRRALAAYRRPSRGRACRLADSTRAMRRGPGSIRAAHAVEDRLAALGNGYLGGLVDDFEARWRERPADEGLAFFLPA